MKRKSKILIGSAIAFVALFVALYIAGKQIGGGPGSPTYAHLAAERNRILAWT